MTSSPTTKGSQQAANRTLAQSWAALPASTRIRFSLAMCGVAIAGIYVSDYLEKSIPTDPQTESK
ncbi:hypothetical protein VKT23_005439 [Stygiomarasmius scandens]|uniref:Uncharacterized protein n=1 Tax=Marasmiellus scandens TaxID=2682957 RepID=A0ABR1JQA1_9AGAR